MNNPLVSGPQNLTEILSQLRQNPIGILRQRGFNLPTNLNDPQAIVQHLLNSGQVSQQQVNQAQIMAQRLGLR